MRPVILASQSPRRKELLEKIGVLFTAVSSDFEEHLDDSRDPKTVSIELALGKARVVAQRHPDALVIGSDTIVSVDGVQIGKQESLEQARNTLYALAGKASTITTSVVLVCKEQDMEETAADEALVYFKPADDQAIQTYLASGDWKDKAGYGVQSGAAVLIDHIEGDYTTVVGLPTTVLGRMLKKHGIATVPVHLDAPVPIHSR